MSINFSIHGRIRRPFDYIHSGSAGRCLDDLYLQILTDSVVNDWCQSTSENQLSVKTDLKFRVTRTGRIRIRRFYWSLQRQAQSSDVNFNARTLVLEPDSSPQWLDFPVDPQIPSASDLLTDSEQKRVFHYVPLRRLTILRQCAKHKLSVVKLKRAGRAQDASFRLRQINASHIQSPISFSLPINLVDDCQHEYAYQQTYCPGTTLGELLRRSPSAELFQQLGRRLASFHTQSVSKLPIHHDCDLVAFSEKIRQLTALWPTEADRILNCHHWLLRGRPETELTLCHGDLSLENILVDGDQWSLIDLDLAHLGDPIRDIAQLLVQLEGNLPTTDEEQWARREALLSGYQSVRPESISSRALHRHGCRAELEFLYVTFRKDIGTAHSRAAALVRAERHCREIGQ